MDAVGSRQIVVADEAYRELVEVEDFPNGIDLMEQYSNSVVFRTFSKTYGLAGLRIGCLAGNLGVVNAIGRACVVYSVNALAQEAALAAVDADDHVLRARKMVRTGMEFLKKELALLGLTCVAGEGNYLMVWLPISDTLAYRKLMSQGVMARTMTGFRFPNCIRVTIAKMEAMEVFIQALAGILSMPG